MKDYHEMWNTLKTYIDKLENEAFRDSMIDMEVYKNICYISDMIDILSRKGDNE